MTHLNQDIKYNVLRLPEVKSQTGLSRSAIYQRIAEGTFPKQINLGGRAVGWLEEDIQNWIETTLINLSWGFSKNKSISEIISGNRKLAYLLSEILNLYIDNPYHDIYVASGCIEPYCTSFVECFSDYREIEKYEIPPKSTLTATRDALEKPLETSNLNIHDEQMHLKNVLSELKELLFNCWEADNQWKLRAWLDDILEEYGLRG